MRLGWWETGDIGGRMWMLVKGWVLEYYMTEIQSSTIVIAYLMMIPLKIVKKKEFLS